MRLTLASPESVFLRLCMLCVCVAVDPSVLHLFHEMSNTSGCGVARILILQWKLHREPCLLKLSLQN